MFDTNFNSIDSRHSDLDDGTEATLIDATSEANQASKGIHHSRSSTPQSHKDSCPGPDLERLTDLLPNRRENLLPLRNDYPEDIDELQPCLKRKRSQYESDDAPQNLGQDSTNGKKVSWKLDPNELKSKFGYLINEIVGVLEAVSRVEAAIGRQSKILSEALLEQYVVVISIDAIQIILD
ncbi:hypothetical protein BD769DRAFT_1388686 [Suillus cothurnatus]|nr:hypothetical protein BD769DRAFT_1388686 [Suillus cothurnatus]